MYCANSLSRLRLRVARLYLHSGISDILIHVETLILEHLRHDVRPEIYIYIYIYRERERERERESVPLDRPESSLRSQLLVGCKHRASEGVFYIVGRGCVLYQFIGSGVARLYLHCVISHWADTRRNI